MKTGLRSWRWIVGGALPAIVLFCPAIAASHGGVTPEQVMIDMKYKGTGPYASPMFRNQNGLAQDWLGIAAMDYQEGGRSGVRITGIRDEGPAGNAGIEVDDVVTAVNTQPIASLADLNNFMSQIKSAGEFEFSLLRKGKPTDATVYLSAGLGEIDSRLAGVMRGETQPNPETMRNSMQETMIAQTPVSNSRADRTGGQVGPGMFREEMMGKAPIGHMGQGGQVWPAGKAEDLLDSYLQRKLADLQKTSESPDKEEPSYRQIDLEYKKFIIKNNADNQLARIDLEEALSAEKPDMDKIATAAQRLDKLSQERTQTVLEFIKQLSKEK